jgi:hypothetical protein
VRSVQLLVNASDPSAPAAAREKLFELVVAGATDRVLAPIPPLPPAQWLAQEIT